MLQDLGDTLKNRKSIMVLVFTPLILLFVVWGASGVVSNFDFGTPNYGIKVNGEEVPLTEMQRAWQERQSRYQQIFKGEIPALQRKALQQQLEQEKVAELLIRQRASRRGMRVSEAMLADAWRSQEQFQTDGKFDRAKAVALLAGAQITPEAYDRQLREQSLGNQLVQGVEIGGFLTASERARIVALENERRSLRYAVLPLAKYEASAAPDEAALRAWYAAHGADYEIPEWATVDYAELNLADLEAGVKVDDKALGDWFAENSGRYGTVERRRAAHILFEVPAGADAKAEAAARAKAASVLAELRAGKDFAALAKQYSADPGSAGAGGDVGWTEAKGAFDQAFTDALFKLGKGEISEPVRTRFGFHLIRLVDLEAAGGKTLATARAEIEKDYRHDLATRQFGEQQDRLQAWLESGKSADLGELVRQFGMKAGSVEHYQRSNGGVLGANAELAAALFGADARSGARLSPPIALTPERTVVARVRAYHAAGVQPFESVKASVQTAVRHDLAGKAAVAAAEATVKQLRAGTGFDAALKALGLTAAPARDVGRGDPQLPVQVRDAAFALPAPSAGQSSFEVVSLEEGGAALLALLDVKAGTGSDNKAADQKLVEPYLDRSREAEMRAYLQQMQNSAKIERNGKAFD